MPISNGRPGDVKDVADGYAQKNARLKLRALALEEVAFKIWPHSSRIPASRAWKQKRCGFRDSPLIQQALLALSEQTKTDTNLRWRTP